MSHGDRSASEIRAGLDHPVVDADGHLVEYWPEIDVYLKREGVGDGLASFLTTANFDGSKLWGRLTPEERLAQRAYRSPWWGFPNDARDLASACAPQLLHSRLDELGIDLAVCYPSIGLQLPAQREEKLRRLGCRAYNRYAAEQFEGLSDRLLPVASIPTCTPDEAVEELEFAVQELGFRAVVVGGFAIRGFEGASDEAFWIDSLSLDSLYDYDPFWQRCVELGVVPTFHSGSMGWSGRRSVSNFSYNHMGHFGAASETSAKSMFFGGVLHRFPALRAAFLEGGVAWAMQMFVSLIEHWEKRGPEGLKERDPAGIDADLFDTLIDEHQGKLSPVPGFGSALSQMLATPDVVNDFEAAGITCADDIVRQITTQCFFGCEADDRLAGLAFDEKRLGGALSPIFSSDIGHWDVAHMRDVLPEAYEHIEYNWMDAAQFRAFTCDNTVRMYTDANPDFFSGTVVEAYAKTS